MTDLQYDVNACLRILVNAAGQGPVDDSDLPEGYQALCWVCMSPWPCDATREGRPNDVQLAAARRTNTVEESDA